MYIRHADRHDAERLSALAIQVWLHTYATEGISSSISRYVLTEFTPRKFEELLSSPSTTVLVAEVNEKLAGYSTIGIGTSCPVPTDAEVELVTLYVQAPFIGKGVGSALLSHAEKSAMQIQNSPLWLTVNSKNSRAIEFYAKHGYSKIGITYFELGDEKHENLVLVGRDMQ